MVSEANTNWYMTEYYLQVITDNMKVSHLETKQLLRLSLNGIIQYYLPACNAASMAESEPQASSGPSAASAAPFVKLPSAPSFP